MLSTSITDACAQLPELYQPIFCHPELNSEASRGCIDRFQDIAAVHDALRAWMGRPLSILDLGCAQGFFSFSLASRHAEVVGIDNLPQNISLCRLIAAEHPNLQVLFECNSIEDFLGKELLPHFDMVLGLNVFHHICHQRGMNYARQLLAALSRISEVLIFEVGLRCEPLAWGRSLPEDPREFLADFAFCHQLSAHPTHLSDVQRPMYFCSNSFWCLGGKLEYFDSWTAQQHELVGNNYVGTRRYFFWDSTIVKHFVRKAQLADINKDELEREVEFLRSPPAHFAPVPKLYDFGITEEEAWLVRATVPGERLSKLILNGCPYDPCRIVLAILQQLVYLERDRLYHSDVRSWNIIVGEDGAPFLIDFGAITKQARDVVWPYNLYLSFLIFIREVYGRYVSYLLPTRSPLLLPEHFPEDIRPLVSAVWQTPHREWSFALLYRLLVDPSQRHPTTGPIPQENVEVWMSVMEQQLDQACLHQNRQP